MTHFPDQSSPRHRRDYFATAVEAVPPLLQALAAIAASVAFAFANHRFVALWSVIIVAALSVLVLVISGIWSWRARRLLVDREAKVPSERGRGLSVNAPTWSWGAVIAGAILISGSIFILVRGLMPSPNYSSPYDGLNPQQSPCLDSAKKVPGGNTTLFDDSGRSVGVVILTQQAAVRLKDYTIKIIIERPGDSVEIPYAIALNGATVAYGSMLSDSQACVRAEVTLRPNNSSSYGKYSVTPCIAQT